MNHPNTYYSQTLKNTPKFKSLTEQVEVDVCIIGAGLAGLSCAQSLCDLGYSVVVLEAKKIAWGASGRNGGIVAPGFANGQNYIEKKLGLKVAQSLFSLSQEGVEIIRNNIKTHKLKGVAMTEGKLSVIRYNNPSLMKTYCANMCQKYDYELEFIDRDAMADYAQTESYFQGNFDKQSFHFHPLNYCLGMAQVIVKQGAQIFENSEVTDMQLDTNIKLIKAENGSVSAKHVVLCGGGYSGKVYGKINKSILPIATYVITTEKLGSQVHEFVKTPAAIIDDRKASDYYRIVDNDRLLWGGRITARISEPKQLGKLIKSDMLNVYPALKDAKVDYSWSGLMAYARHRMPYIGEIKKGVWACTAFGGHGMNTAPIGGRIIAEAIARTSGRYTLFRPFKLHWNGGIFGPMASQTTYVGMRFADWWRENKS